MTPSYSPGPLLSATWILKWDSQSIFLPGLCFLGGGQVLKQTRYSSAILATYKSSVTPRRSPRLSQHSIQVQVFTARDQRIDTVIVFFVAFFLREVFSSETRSISLESMSVCADSIRRGIRPSENVWHLARPLMHNKFLLPDGTSVFSSVTSVPPRPRLESGGLRRRESTVGAILIVLLQIFYPKPRGCRLSHRTSENRSTRTFRSAFRALWLEALYLTDAVFGCNKWLNRFSWLTPTVSRQQPVG